MVYNNSLLNTMLPHSALPTRTFCYITRSYDRNSVCCTISARISIALQGNKAITICRNCQRKYARATFQMHCLLIRTALCKEGPQIWTYFVHNELRYCTGKLLLPYQQFSMNLNDAFLWMDLNDAFLCRRIIWVCLQDLFPMLSEAKVRAVIFMGTLM